VKAKGALSYRRPESTQTITPLSIGSSKGKESRKRDEFASNQKDIRMKDLTSALWLKGMTAEEFEAWWSQGLIAKKWFNLTESQRGQARNIKLLYKDILTRRDVDVGLIFGLMSLASDLHRELIKNSAYVDGCHGVWAEHHSEFLKAVRTLKENPFAPPALKSLSADVESIASGAKHLIANELYQGAKNAVAKTREPDHFLGGLIFLDSMPGAKSRYLRSFFACLFAKHLKTNRKGLIGRILQFCFDERLTAKGLKQTRADFRESFPNWRRIADHLFGALRFPKSKPSKLPLLG